MVEINWTVLPQIANFLILIFILNIVVYKPIRKILLERRDKFQGLAEGIESAGQMAQEKDQAFNSGLKEARVKGQKEKEALLQAASDEEKEIEEKVRKVTEKADLFLLVVDSKVGVQKEDITIAKNLWV